MKKSPLSVRIIYVFSSIAFWLLIAVTAAAFIFNSMLHLNAFGDELDLNISLPATFEVAETGFVDLGSKPNEIRIVEATGKMQIVDTPIFLAKMLAALLFVVLGLALFMTWKFRMFITNIKKGVIFDIININNLKHIAYGLMVLFFLSRVYDVILYQGVAKYLEFETIVFNGIREDNSAMLVSALLLWVLAHIFIKGVEIKEDQELTI